MDLHANLFSFLGANDRAAGDLSLLRLLWYGTEHSQTDIIKTVSKYIHFIVGLKVAIVGNAKRTCKI